MEFSVLMSLYAKERPEYLRESLDSVFHQTVPPTEVVMVEDGPLNDELYGVLDETEKAHPEMKRVRLEKNGGLGAALNEGLKHCTHELVARMDTDDIAVADRFEKQTKVFEHYPQVEVVSAWIQEFDSETGEDTSIRKLPEYNYEIFRYGQSRCPVNHPVVMFRKKSVEFAGGYLPFPLFEDYYLWVRLLLNGVKFYNIQECLLRFRTSPEMYKRRGGLKHALTEVKFLRHIRKLGFISINRFVASVVVRFTTRVSPNFLREWIYRKLLR
ncbi:MAG: glycosyltransferase [Duncaniella sp.]|nr:glycosyltransferase [Duncaniella sp.]